jgi:two-component system aerobic respiration control sensor histidine kinase ArcB
LNKEDFFSLRKIIALMPGHVFWKNKDGVYYGCNNHHADFFKLPSPESIIGLRNHDLMNQELSDRLDKFDQEIMASKKDHFLEETTHDKHGNPAIFYTQKSPLFDDNGDVVGLLGISINITERKRIEEELRIAKEKAEAANRAKGQFLAVINHELRTPLTGIIGLVNMLKKGHLTARDEAATIEDLENCAEHLLSLVNDVLDFTRLEAERISVQLMPVNIAKVIDEVLSILTGLAVSRNIQFNVNLDNTLPDYILTDGRGIRQILLNFINNAIKFTENGSITITTETTPINDKRVQLKISVIDTGLGIPADKLKTIFEPFQQLEDPYLRQSSRSGTGLGLAIVRRLCKMMGFSIDVKSEIGKGSVFSIQGEFDITETPNHSNQVLQKTQTVRLQHHPKILLIEDDKIVQRIHQTMLEDLGCKVTIATTGQEAIQMIDHHQLILVDIGLSDMTGFEIIRRIRANNRPDLPVIVLTGYTGEEERIACFAAGANEVAIKPVTAQALNEMLVRYLG